jgi:hypothetical protein
MALKLGEHGEVRFSIRELPRQRFRLSIELVIAGKVVKELGRHDYDREPTMWQALSDLAADRQAEFALKAAEERKL